METDMALSTFTPVLRGMLLSSILAAHGMVWGSAAVAEETLRSLTAFPSSDATASLYDRFVQEVNTRGKGIVQIEVVGGPEAIPGLQQIDAVGRSVVDMTYGPLSYVLGTMPEADAWVGSDVPPLVSRENGGFALIQKIGQEKLGVHILSRFAPAAPVNLWFLQEPKLKANGEIDLTGLRLRASPLYNAFYESLGAVPVSIPVPDVYTGLERGTFDGMGYPASSIEGWGWDKFLKYRLEPSIFQTDLGIYISPKKWDALSEEARTILTDTAAAFEETSYTEWQSYTKEVTDKLEGNGMQVITLEGPARDAFVNQAYDSVWARLKASGSPDYEKLRAAYFTH
jgi:TRAP-type transport system periplasmic protein